MEETQRFVGLLRESRRALVCTGAGISTRSGIPDFRGPKGLWKRRRPVCFDEFLASEERRLEYWDQKAEVFEAFRRARPNATHRAIARLESLGRLEAVVTQNIDGLHQDAGNSAERVIEVHGSGRRVRCLECGEASDPAQAIAAFRARRSAPRCPCGGLLKPATISFGQSLERDVVERAFAAAEEADLVLALGSTLSVHPAASVPLAAARRGAPYVIINRGATDHDGLATLRIDGDVAELLAPVVEVLAREEAA